MRALTITALAISTVLIPTLSANAQSSAPRASDQVSSITVPHAERKDEGRTPGEVYHYRPCPAEVEFPSGRHACLGTPN